jgi:hypothetical protein
MLVVFRRKTFAKFRTLMSGGWQVAGFGHNFVALGSKTVDA